MTDSADRSDSANLTRASLLERLGTAAHGDREQAWADFQTRYVPIITGFAARCGADRQDVEDIVQDVLAAFLGAQREFVYDRNRGRFRGYLKTITVRAAIRRAGKNLRFRGIPLEEVFDVDLAVEPLWDDVWEQELVSQALRIVRAESQDRLSFLAFEQYVLLDRSAEIVAAELGTSVNNVHQAKTRVAKQLREVIQRLRASEL